MPQVDDDPDQTSFTSLSAKPHIWQLQGAILASDKFDGRTVVGSVQPGESMPDYRTRIARLQAEALEQRRKQLAEQTSVLNSPADRIRVWESRHQIDLPRDPGHRLVNLIAANTGLSTEEVRVEQRLRAAAHSRTN